MTKIISKAELINLIDSVPLKDQEALIQIAYNAIKPKILTYINQYKAVSNQLGFIDPTENQHNVNFQIENVEVGKNVTAEKLDPLLSMFTLFMKDCSKIKEEIENIRNGVVDTSDSVVTVFEEIDKISDDFCLEHKEIADANSESAEFSNVSEKANEPVSSAEESVNENEADNSGEVVSESAAPSDVSQEQVESLNNNGFDIYESSDEEEDELNKSLAVI